MISSLIESVDKIIQGNVSNIVFLKSTDDSMLDTLTKLSGQKHKIVIDQEVVTKDEQRQFNSNESMISVTKQQKEVPVIEMNDLLYISQSKNNSVVFRAGDFPIWNRNTTAMPMSFRLFQDTIIQPGKEKYSLQTVPTLSTASEFDVRKNQPNFYRILEKRVEQARLVPDLMQKYKEMHGYNDHDMEMLDPDILADEIMSAVQIIMEEKHANSVNIDVSTENDLFGMDDEEFEELADMIDVYQQEAEESQLKRYANGCLSREDFYPQGRPNHQFDSLFAKAFQSSKQYFVNDMNFRYDGSSDSLMGVRSGAIMVESTTKYDANTFDALTESSNVYGDIDDASQDLKYRVTDAFYKYLADCSTWDRIAGGNFAKEVERLYKADEVY